MKRLESKVAHHHGAASGMGKALAHPFGKRRCEGSGVGYQSKSE
jgi:NAD(P)-dependent dehydrogenase (short-subunit alcohol dehydrogenase family)